MAFCPQMHSGRAWPDITRAVCAATMAKAVRTAPKAGAATFGDFDNPSRIGAGRRRDDRRVADRSKAKSKNWAQDDRLNQHFSLLSSVSRLDLDLNEWRMNRDAPNHLERAIRTKGLRSGHRSSRTRRSHQALAARAKGCGNGNRRLRAVLLSLGVRQR